MASQDCVGHDRFFDITVCLGNIIESAEQGAALRLPSPHNDSSGWSYALGARGADHTDVCGAGGEVCSVVCTLPVTHRYFRRCLLQGAGHAASLAVHAAGDTGGRQPTRWSSLTAQGTKAMSAAATSTRGVYLHMRCSLIIVSYLKFHLILIVLTHTVQRSLSWRALAISGQRQ